MRQNLEYTYGLILKMAVQTKVEEFKEDAFFLGNLFHSVDKPNVEEFVV